MRLRVARRPIVMVLAALFLAALGGRFALGVVRSRGQFGSARAGTE